MLVVEQDARVALSISSRAYVLEVGRIALAGTRAPRCRTTKPSGGATWVLMLAAGFADFVQQVVSGLASGGRLCTPRARARHHPPLDRGHQLRAGRDGPALGVPRVGTDSAPRLAIWPAFVATLVLSFAGGVATHRIVIRPVEEGVLRIVIVTIRLLIAINGFVLWQWGGEPRALQSPFGNDLYDIGGVVVTGNDIGTIAVAFGIVLLLWALFRFTKVGLAIRAAAVNPHGARLVGVRVTWMLALGWGLAATLGAVAGLLTAPTVGLDPNMMQAVLIYAFAAAVLGGIDSPVGAVVGGLLLGVLLNLLSYLSPYDVFDWFSEERGCRWRSSSSSSSCSSSPRGSSDDRR